jgi:16S rRNA U1498 N3-methylase RsmE
MTIYQKLGGDGGVLVWLAFGCACGIARVSTSFILPSMDERLLVCHASPTGIRLTTNHCDEKIKSTALCFYMTDHTIQIITKVILWMMQIVSSLSYVRGGYRMWFQRQQRQTQLHAVLNNNIIQLQPYTTNTKQFLCGSGAMIPCSKSPFLLKRNYRNHYFILQRIMTTRQFVAHGDDNVNENIKRTEEILKLPRIYVGQIQLKPVPVSNMTDIANAITSKTKRLEVPPLRYHSMIYLSDDQAHYVTTVLRMFKKYTSLDKTKNAPQLRVFADGDEWLANLYMMEPTIFTSKQIQRGTNMNPPNKPVALCKHQLGSIAMKKRNRHYPNNATFIHCWLCVALPKNKDRVRYMIEKTTELDCTGYIFIDTDYSQETTDDYQKKKFPKMQSYCIEAAEQCERLNLPHFITVIRETNPNPTLEQLEKELLNVSTITKLKEFLQIWSEQIENGVALLICRERANTMSVWTALEQIYHHNNYNNHNHTTSMNHDIVPKTTISTTSIIDTTNTGTTTTKAVVFIIGPEGGWSIDEQRMFNILERDFPNQIYNIALSSTILRTETAAITAMSTFAIHSNYIHIKQPQ